MRIYDISATDNSIIFKIDSDHSGEVTVKAYSPALKEKTLIGQCNVIVEGNSFSIDRYQFKTDGAFLRYETDISGVVFTSKVQSQREVPYPQCDTKKGLQVSMVEDALELGVRHAAINVCIGDLLRKEPGENTETFQFNGHSYFIFKEAIETLDKRLIPLTQVGININLILLCGKKWLYETPKDMYDVLLHPDYDDEGTLSMFNLHTEEGIRHYQAFVAYLTQRYTNPSFPAKIVGFIIANEVQSAWIWSNAGEKTVEEFSTEYTTAVRLAVQVSESICSNIRVYMSFDNYWTSSHAPDFPKRFYGAKYILDNVIKLTKAEGNFYWNIAYHSYPQDMSKPDFWNDDEATDDDDTLRITFNNLEVLARYIRQPQLLFNGNRRRIILSEQGFNSCFTPESEILQAIAYGRAYKKVMEIEEIDAFILYAHRDHQYEFGLNLGIWRRKPDSDELDGPKPIYHLVKTIDKKDHTGKYLWERF